MFGGDVLCVWERHSTLCVCLGKRDAGRPSERVGEEMCASSRDKVIETYIGVRTLEERGVLMCSCVGVWGR